MSKRVQNVLEQLDFCTDEELTTVYSELSQMVVKKALMRAVVDKLFTEAPDDYEELKQWYCADCED